MRPILTQRRVSLRVMDHFRLRKYRGPEVWAKVREAYIAGEPGPQVAKRFDVGLANLRKKARLEGWTRTATARASDLLILATQPDVLGIEADAGREDAATSEPPDPATAARMAIERAAALIAAGRAAEASALLKAAETLGRLTAEAAPPAEPEREPTPEEAAAFEARVRAEWEAYHADVRAEADRLARAMLEGTDPGHIHMLHAKRWRAEVLGPEVGRADYEQAKQFSSSPRSWTKEGELLPADAHDDRNWEQDRPRLLWAARGGSREE